MKKLNIIISLIFTFNLIGITSKANITNPTGLDIENSNTNYSKTLINTTKAITQHGITWYFSEPIIYGQFINGDYWVVPVSEDVKIIKITPGYKETHRKLNGSMINPTVFPHGYDSYRYYSDEKNVGIGISEKTPLSLKPGESLVSTISNETIVPKDLFINSAAVLTCLEKSPPLGTFRPGLSAKNKTLHNFNSVKTSLLKRLAVPGGITITAETLKTYAEYLKMPWLTHHSDYQVETLHPSASGLSEYYYPVKFAEMALMLNLDFSDEEKRDLLINYIQLGIDCYSFIESGEPGWYPNGGHGNGRKWPILFAGIMLNYEPMKNIGLVSGDYLYTNGYGPKNPPPNYKHFTEDGQTFYVRQYDIDLTSNTSWVKDARVSGQYLFFDKNRGVFTIAVPQGAVVGPWEPDTRNDDTNGVVRCRPYTASMLGMPEWGIRHSRYPEYSDADWSANYRTIGSGAPTWAGVTLAARIMGAKNLWNNNALFDYVDRYVAITSGNPDPFGYKVTNEKIGGAISGLIGVMWNYYRSHESIVDK